MLYGPTDSPYLAEEEGRQVFVICLESGQETKSLSRSSCLLTGQNIWIAKLPPTHTHIHTHTHSHTQLHGAKTRFGGNQRGLIK